MKKTVFCLFLLVLTVSLITVRPASARPHRPDPFWHGVAAGVGTAIVLGHLFHPRVYCYDARPVRVYTPPAYVPPPPEPVYRERWVPGHWVEETDGYGNWERYWVPGHWERVY
jgi:hypothetical protein